MEEENKLSNTTISLNWDFYTSTFDFIDKVIRNHTNNHPLSQKAPALGPPIPTF